MEEEEGEGLNLKVDSLTASTPLVWPSRTMVQREELGSQILQVPSAQPDEGSQMTPPGVQGDQEAVSRGGRRGEGTEAGGAGSGWKEGGKDVG